MGIARDMQFGPEDVIATDGGNFIECRFEGSTLIYSGGEHPRFENCVLTDIGWAFADHALRTVQFLQTLNGAPGGAEFVGRLFAPGVIIGDPFVPS